MSHQRSNEDRLEAIEEVLIEVLRTLRKDENEFNRLLRRIRPPATYPRTVALVAVSRPD